MFEDLADLTGIGPGSRVLEIGPGTGQATLPLAERGCRVVAVELGPDLAAVARRNLARFPTVEVVTAAFEDWPLPREPFDLVLAATAPARSSTGQAGSVPRRSAATNGSCRTPRPATSRSPLRPPRLHPTAKAGLLDCVARLIDHGSGGRITKRYLTELRAAFTVGP